MRTIRSTSRGRFAARTRGLAIVALAATLATSLGAGATGSPTPGTAAQVSALVAASVKITTVNATVESELPGAAADIADLVYQLPAICETATSCVYGDTTGAQTIVLFGNSHARMWFPAINAIAIADKLKLVLLGKNSCPVVTMDLSATKFPDCNAVTSAVVPTINALKPSLVILADRTVDTGYTASEWQKGMEATIKAIAPSGAKVDIIGDIQEFDTPPPACLAAHLTDIQKYCGAPNPNPKEKGLMSAEMAAAKAERDVYVNPTPWLCTRTKCSPVIGNYIAYWGSDHVSVTYSLYLTTVMAAALKSTLPRRS